MRKVAIAAGRWLLALALLLPTSALLRALPRLPASIKDGNVTMLLLVGLGGGLALFGMVSRFQPVYVLGHELTHWLTAKLFRRKTGRFRVRGNRGSVNVERPNIWITLSPYFVPLYTLLWVGVCGMITLFADLGSPWVYSVTYLGVGFTYAYHVVLTFHALHLAQTDLVRYGRPLSVSLIFFCNVLVVYGVLLMLSGQWSEGLRLPVQHMIEHVSALVALVG